MNEKLVLIGAGGIGTAVAELYSNKGLDIIVGDIDQQKMADLAKKCNYKQIIPYQVDIRKIDSVNEFAENVKKDCETITHYIFAAGWALKPGRNTEHNEFEGLLGTNLGAIHDSIILNLAGPLYIARALLPLMIEDKNENKTMTLVSSINALQDYGLPAYSAAKAGMTGFIKATTGEFGKYNIRGNVIVPGTVLSQITYTHKTADLEKLFSGSALKDKLTKPEEVAQSIYAITHLMTSMTGQCLVLDAGQTTITPWSAKR
ncbi:SDR family oxidoreductase [Candidatus Woesearchaeota archaeon]|nr:SDR family oxidoreductase [Candidatus Woesearchaeota archaeon]